MLQSDYGLSGVQNADHSNVFGFVNFSDPTSAVSAREALHEKIVDGCKLYVDRAQSRDERKQLLDRQQLQERSAASPHRAGVFQIASFACTSLIWLV
jgi:RNA recognition motif-containing protein